MRKVALVIAFLLALLPASSQEATRHYVNETYHFSLDYPADFMLIDDPKTLRSLMDMGNEMMDTSKLSPAMKAAMENVGPQLLLKSPAGGTMVCITTPVSEAALSVPTMELARLSLKQALATVPGSRSLSEPAEVMVGKNLLVTYAIELQLQGEKTTRQRQYMVRNSDLHALYIFGITVDSDASESESAPFQRILEGLQLDFSSGERGQG